jgi:2-oxoglutarate dehydrogenase E2 component (dihydrolipoamide succinyltransferase)
MSIEVRVPTLGESIVEATISQWLKKEGDSIEVGEPLLELETDKVNLEVPSDHAGVLVSISRGEGDTVSIGDVLGVIDAPGAVSRQQDGQPSRDEEPPPPAEERVSQVPETSPLRDAQVAVDGGADDSLATPVAQRIAEANNLDIQYIPGSGPSGRVTKEDVLTYIQEQRETEPNPSVAARQQPPVGEQPQPVLMPQSQPSGGQGAAPAPSPAGVTEGRREERQRMSRRRQTIARRLVEAQQTAAMLTTFNEIDMSAVKALRARRQEGFSERNGVSLGYMSFFVRATIGALKAFPLLNAEVQGEEIVLKQYYDIGIAVGTEQGLVVPVLRDADRKTFAQIERGIGELASRARVNALSLDDLQGGTFSITNGGIYGSLMSTPILNTPQVGILGMHKIEDRPVVVNGAVEVRPMMYVALSYDHRIVDGSEAVRFLVQVKELVEDPEALLLEG